MTTASETATAVRTALLHPSCRTKEWSPKQLLAMGLVWLVVLGIAAIFWPSLYLLPIGFALALIGLTHPVCYFTHYDHEAHSFTRGQHARYVEAAKREGRPHE